jgi:hypothetical protein
MDGPIVHPYHPATLTEVNPMATRSQLRRQLLRNGRALVQLDHGPGPGPITVVVLRGQAAIVDGQGGGTRAPVPPATPAPAPLTPEQEEIMAVLTDEPMRGKHIAKRIGHPANGYFRGLLRDLVVRGHVRHVRGSDGGYVRA